MTQEELNKVLERHLHWLRKDCDGWKNMRAILDGENLDGLNLNWASLDRASLRNASLNKTSLDRVSFNDASLDEASFKGTSLSRVSFEGSSLNNVSFNESILKMVSFKSASLISVSFRDASLYGVSFNWARLYDALLDGASFNRGCSFYKATFDMVSFKKIKSFPFIPIACPDEGSFIGWKKAHDKIIKLEIPADAKRCSATSNKCRCDKAKVLAIQNLDGSISDITEIASNYDKKFMYKVGETVSVKNFCNNRWQECSQGIHFFINRQSAVEY